MIQSTIPFALVLVTAAGTGLSAQGKVQDQDAEHAQEVKKTASGLQYSVLHAGPAGIHPKPGDIVTVHYTGWLPDGKEFDSSRRRGQPAHFELGKVIKGWNEGLTLMTPGSRYKFTIPPELAYGDRGAPPDIPPKATLIFDVELISVASFAKLSKEKVKKTESGLEYELVDPGKGELPGKDHAVNFDFAFWNTDGKFLQSSMIAPPGRRPVPIKGRAADFRIAVLKEVPFLLKPGGSCRVKVPAMPGILPQDTIWYIRLNGSVAPLAVPKFVKPSSETGKVLKTESGLQYQVVKKGKPDGKQPKMGQLVTCHYAGWLENGDLFDSSFGRGEPSTFQLGRVIRGWNEGLQLMREGAIYRFLIPADLAYGPQGRPPKIGPNATLVFYVELVKVGS